MTNPVLRSLMLCGLATLMLQACANDTKSQVDKAAAETGKAADKVGNDVANAASDAAKAAEKTAKKTGQAVGQAAKDTGAAIDKATH